MNQKQQILHVKFPVGWLSFVITLIFLMGLLHHCYLSAWKQWAPVQVEGWGTLQGAYGD